MKRPLLQPPANLWLKKPSGPARTRSAWPDPRLARALLSLERRIRGRYWLESLRLALLWGGAAAAALLTLLRLTPMASPVQTALASGALMAAAAIALRFWQRPDALAVTHIADACGLKGQAITTFRLLQKSHTDPWEQTAAEAGLAACRGFQAANYPLMPSWQPWRGTVLVLGLLLTLALTPSPLEPYWEARREEERALAAAAAFVQEALAPLEKLHVAQKPLLDEVMRQELDALTRELEEAGGREEAAAELLKAKQQLDKAAEGLNPAAPEDAARLASLWQESDPTLSEALREGDPQKAGKAARAFWQRAAAGNAAEREQAALQLYRSAEAAKDPSLRQALRKAAQALNQQGSRGGGEKFSDAAASDQAEALEHAVASLAEGARAGTTLASAGSALNQLATALTSGASASMLAQSGNSASETCATTGSSEAG